MSSSSRSSIDCANTSRIANWTTARETAGLLLQDALDGGGTDNITIILGRVNPLERRHDTLDAGQGTRETD